MAFTCRTEEKHDQILSRICKKAGITVKQKALLFVVEQFEQICEDREKFSRRISELENELSRLKKAICLKIKADENLLKCVEPTEIYAEIYLEEHEK
jgi:hypothetical protein